MSLKDQLHTKIVVDREAGRDIPPVIEELFLMVVDFVERSPQPTVSNDHVAEGAIQFTPEEIAMSAPNPAPQTPAVAEIQQ